MSNEGAKRKLDEIESRKQLDGLLRNCGIERAPAHHGGLRLNPKAEKIDTLEEFLESRFDNVAGNWVLSKKTLPNGGAALEATATAGNIRDLLRSFPDSEEITFTFIVPE